jgi:ribosomal protein S6
MREYELAVVYDLTVTEAGGPDASVQHMTHAVEARGGTVVKVDHWGRRRLAYPIGRAADADYIISRVELDPTAVNALEASLRIDERIYRHLIVRADELPPPPVPREPRRMPEQAEAAVPAAAVVAPEAAAAVAAAVAAEPEPAAPAAVVAVAAPEAAAPAAAVTVAEPEAAAVAPPEAAAPVAAVVVAEPEAVAEPEVLPVAEEPAAEPEAPAEAAAPEAAAE